jgi:hypothetical protein
MKSVWKSHIQILAVQFLHETWRQIKIVAVRFLRETATLQFGKNHIRTCALKLSCYIFKIVAYVTQWMERV